MLKGSQSLALRAALIFVPIYVGISLAGMTLLSFVSLSAGERHHSGPRVALTYVGDELLYTSASLRLPRDGPFGQLAAKNPSLWVLAEDNGRLYSVGPVPPQARAAFKSYVGVVAANFHVPGVRRPLSDAALQRHESAYGRVLLAAGGVDPETISVADSFRYFLSQGLFFILGILALFGLLAMLVALPLLTRSLRPLTRETASISPDNPIRRINERNVPKELLPLVRGFNSALDSLSNEIVRRKRIIADLAHELRTPLAIIALQVEALGSDEERVELQRMVTRLGDMVGQMLDLERLAIAGRKFERINLTALASDIIADMAPLAMKAGYEISLAAPPEPVWVNGEEQALSRAIGNLIGNAVAHAGGRGQIKVIVSRDRQLDVVDEGPGVAANVRSNLFEPFARERWDRDGCGLGLHLTREILRVHGGDAILVPTERGATFRVQFPAAD